MKTITINTYSFDELSQSAQEKALIYFRQNMYFDYDLIIEDTTNVADLFGLYINPKHIYWDLDHGGFLTFDGQYTYKKGGLKAVETEHPTDTKLHNIVARLTNLQKRYFYGIRAECYTSGRNSMTQRVSVDHRDSIDISKIEDGITECLMDFGYWILRQLRDEYEYQCSYEYLKKMAEANTYTFDEKGNLI